MPAEVDRPGLQIDNRLRIDAEEFNKQIKTAVGAMPLKEAEIGKIGAKVNLALNGVCAETINLANSTKVEDKKLAAAHMHEKCDAASLARMVLIALQLA